MVYLSNAISRPAFCISAVILDSILYVALIWLLVTVYTLLHHCLCGPSGPLPPRRSTFLIIHYSTCLVLLCLYIVILVANIFRTFDLVYRSDIGMTPAFDGLTDSGDIVALVFSVLFLITTIDVLLVSIWLVWRAYKSHSQIKVQIFTWQF